MITNLMSRIKTKMETVSFKTEQTKFTIQSAAVHGARGTVDLDCVSAIRVNKKIITLSLESVSLTQDVFLRLLVKFPNMYRVHYHGVYGVHTIDPRIGETVIERGFEFNCRLGFERWIHRDQYVFQLIYHPADASLSTCSIGVLYPNENPDCLHAHVLIWLPMIPQIHFHYVSAAQLQSWIPLLQLHPNKDIRCTHSYKDHMNTYRDVMVQLCACSKSLLFTHSSKVSEAFFQWSPTMLTLKRDEFHLDTEWLCALLDGSCSEITEIFLTYDQEGSQNRDDLIPILQQLERPLKVRIQVNNFPVESIEWASGGVKFKNLVELNLYAQSEMTQQVFCAVLDFFLSSTQTGQPRVLKMNGVDFTTNQPLFHRVFKLEEWDGLEIFVNRKPYNNGQGLDPHLWQLVKHLSNIKHQVEGLMIHSTLPLDLIQNIIHRYMY